MHEADAAKARAGARAAAEVRSGMVVGLGTGTTAAFAIRAVAARLLAGDVSEIVAIPTSNQTRDLAVQLGIRSSHMHEFRSKIIPRLKKHTKTLYQKKLKSRDPHNGIAEFKQFVIDNVFIDEFENHPFIRSATDESNRAILLPKAKKIALQMISAWMNEVGRD